METTLDTIRDIRLYQPRDGYRFSMDALLLFSFVEMPVVKSIADLGAGSGIIGILLAGRYPEAQTVLLEIQEAYVKLAEKNIRMNGLEGRVSAMRCDIRELSEGKGPRDLLACCPFDLVISNPPFRKPKTGLISPEKGKAIARHEISLRLPEIAGAASRLLRSRGRFFLIYHPSRLMELSDTLRTKRIEIKRLRLVHSTAASEAKMVLVEAVKDGRPGIKVERPLFVYTPDGSYTPELLTIYNKGRPRQNDPVSS